MKIQIPWKPVREKTFGPGSSRQVIRAALREGSYREVKRAFPRDSRRERRMMGRALASRSYREMKGLLPRGA